MLWCYETRVDHRYITSETSVDHRYITSEVESATKQLKNKVEQKTNSLLFYLRHAVVFYVLQGIYQSRKLFIMFDQTSYTATCFDHKMVVFKPLKYTKIEL
jgi:hypothetical protein